MAAVTFNENVTGIRYSLNNLSIFRGPTTLKIGRNQLCPCGSGVKYKRCCGALVRVPHSTVRPALRSIPPEVLAALRRHQAEQRLHEEKHGAIKEIITAEMGEWRFVASGRTLAYSKSWKVFPDFLNNHLHDLLGKEWGLAQIKLPLDDQHPAVQWRTINALAHYGKPPDDNGLYRSDTGTTNAWFRLAYDLYLVEHNAELQRKLLRRLRNPVTFQGARFEAAVAAMMLASGYDLRYSEEKGPGKHPEFYATQRKTGAVLAVEAKSRHRHGILGFGGKVEAIEPESFDIDTLLRDAVAKDTKEPLLIFIEVNVPTLLSVETQERVYQELETAWKAVQERAWPDGFPSVGVVFYNDAAPWYLSESLPKNESSIWALALWPKASRHEFDAKSLLERIGQGCLQRSNIPHEFPKTEN